MASTGEQKARASGQGPNLAPLKELLEAQSIYIQSKDPAGRQQSLEKVSHAIGISRPSSLVKDNLDKVFDPNTMLSNGVLHLALAETKRRRI